MKDFIKVYNFLNPKEKNQILYFVFYLLIATFLEVISISLIFPSLTFIIDSTEKSRFSMILEILNSVEIFLMIS